MRREGSGKKEGGGEGAVIAGRAAGALALKSSTPTMAKTSITNPQSASTLPTRGSAARMDCTRTGMPGTRLSARSGRSARKARMTEKLPKPGKRMGSQARVTTTKSS